MKDTEKMRLWEKVIQATDMLRMPKRSIATFGPTHLNYYYLSALSAKTTRIRQGCVLAERPQILLPSHLEELFEGFPPDAQEFAKELIHGYSDKLRALGYKFRHQPKQMLTSHAPFKETYDKIVKDLGDENLSAVMRGPDVFWEISLVKFTLQMTIKSFHDNKTELEERGLFDPEKRLRSRVEQLFFKAAQSKEMIPALIEFLKSNQLFEEYEDRFFDLIRSSSPRDSAKVPL